MLRIAVACLALAVVAVPTAVPQNTTGDGWVVLLGPGSNFDSMWTTKGNWVLDKEGAIHLQPRPGEKGWERWNMYLWAKQKYSDFEIDFEYKVQKGGNSGFYLHVGDVNEPVKTGIEVQIYDSGSKKADAKLNDHDSGGIIPGVAPTKNAAKPAGEWNRFQITSKGPKLTVVLNGQTVNEVALDKGELANRPSSGAIGFQDHGLPLSLRNIKIRELKEQIVRRLRRGRAARL